MKRIAVVSGANRGIGLEIARQLAERDTTVVATSRDNAKGKAAWDKLKHKGLDVVLHSLDVTSRESIHTLADFVKAEYGGLDILVNNAGVALKGFDAEVARVTVNVNFFGPLHLTDALLPLMRPHARIVMMTSGMADPNILSRDLRAQFTAPTVSRQPLILLMQKFVADVRMGTHAAEGWPSSAYSVSKIGLNALTKVVARELSGDPRHILCNAASPGWVRTDMGGPHAPRPVTKGAETPVWLALLPEGGPQGGIFSDMAEVPF